MLDLKRANKGNIQVDKTSDEQRLQTQILLHRGLTGYKQRKKSAYLTSVKLGGIWRLLENAECPNLSTKLIEEI